MRNGWVLLLLIVGLGCRPPADRVPTSTGKVRVRVFTEPSPVRLLASAGKLVFVATDGDLERWDLDGRCCRCRDTGRRSLRWRRM
jgi:hypothetical protein